MEMQRNDGRIQIKLLTSIKMVVSLWLLMMLSTVAADLTSPYSEDGGGPVNVTARVGSDVIFDCRKPSSNAIFVIWSFKDPESGILRTQTINKATITTRRTVSFQAPNNFRLRIGSVTREDEGLYYCLLVSTLEKLNQVFLKVTED
uniref:Ig-like domain-containing protein n=1 Tax=Homalodisca liturata TaxID=320908 RepID=A0A1B6HE59_9HEMI